jgi:hypothetical protein
VVLKVPLSRKTTRKVRAVEVPFGGLKRKNSLGALKWEIQVKIVKIFTIFWVLPRDIIIRGFTGWIKI